VRHRPYRTAGPSLSLLWRLSPRGACPYCWAVSQSNLFELGGAAGVPNPATPDGLRPLPVDAERSMSVAPLASRMRPRTLDEYSGQRHLLAPGLLLRRAIDADRIQSLIFFGPPGTGKTTLAQIIAARSKSRFEKLNAVESNLAEMRRVLQGANHRLRNTGESTLLFIDEIHRFNRAQQDVLLPDVESGAVKLIGATTHNPFFFINSPLVSRSQVFELKPLDEADLLELLRRALGDAERGLGHLRIAAELEALAHLARVSDGDARKALNSIEIAAMTTPPGSDGVIRIDRSVAEECIQRKAVVYDGDGDAHYDTISAFIKSMRGSDPDATLYWLAKMIHAGEDPRFIARRIMIHAAEDVGLADPMALVLATAACQAAEVIGWPEARIPIAEAALYIATANKSNSVVKAIDAALEDIRSGRTLAVPNHLRDGHYAGSKVLGHGEGYRYAHDFPGHHVAQDYLGAARRFYEPTTQGHERKISERLDQWRKAASENRPHPSGQPSTPKTSPTS
jgi:putative ATPase